MTSTTRNELRVQIFYNWDRLSVAQINTVWLHLTETVMSSNVMLGSKTKRNRINECGTVRLVEWRGVCDSTQREMEEKLVEHRQSTYLALSSVYVQNYDVGLVRKSESLVYRPKFLACKFIWISHHLPKGQSPIRRIGCTYLDWYFTYIFAVWNQYIFAWENNWTKISLKITTSTKYLWAVDIPCQGLN